MELGKGIYTYLLSLSFQGMALDFFTTVADRQAGRQREEVIVMDGLEYIDSDDEEAPPDPIFDASYAPIILATIKRTSYSMTRMMLIIIIFGPKR